jgi:hypothetical protein
MHKQRDVLAGVVEARRVIGRKGSPGRTGCSIFRFRGWGGGFKLIRPLGDHLSCISGPLNLRASGKEFFRIACRRPARSLIENLLSLRDCTRPTTKDEAVRRVTITPRLVPRKRAAQYENLEELPTLAPDVTKCLLKVPCF